MKDTEKKFHESRVMFAQLSANAVVIVVNDPRGHKDWLREEYGIQPDVFEGLVRGYIKDNKAIFYKGSNFEPVNDDARVIEIADIFLWDYTEHVDVYDGVTVGQVGEEWKPLKLVRKAK